MPSTKLYTIWFQSSFKSNRISSWTMRSTNQICSSYTHIPAVGQSSSWKTRWLWLNRPDVDSQYGCLHSGQSSRTCAHFTLRLCWFASVCSTRWYKKVAFSQWVGRWIDRVSSTSVAHSLLLDFASLNSLIIYPVHLYTNWWARFHYFEIDDIAYIPFLVLDHN